MPETEELTGLELSKAAHEAVGVTWADMYGMSRDKYQALIDDGWKMPDWSRWPAHAQLAHAWPLLARWRAVPEPEHVRPRAFDFGICSVPSCGEVAFCILNNGKRNVATAEVPLKPGTSDESAICEAICRALVAAK